MTKKDQNKIRRIAESLRWNVTFNDDDVEFEKFSPAGQDFSFNVSASSIEELSEQINEQYNDFDCSNEAYLWLDDTGHGRDGAPYDMKDVYKDMEACQEMIRELAVEMQTQIFAQNKNERTIPMKSTSIVKICDQCIRAIKSRGEKIFVGDLILYDEEVENICYWCGEEDEELYEVRFE